MRATEQTLTLLILLIVGCGSNVKPPEYTIVGAAGKTPASQTQAAFVDDGYEFHFSKPYDLQKVLIHHKTASSPLTVYTKVEGRWKPIKSVDTNDDTSSEIALDVNTDAIRIQPQNVKSGQMALCQFYVRKPQRTFSIPLEKPPFIK
jgi:hypothetical protein